MSYRPKTIDGKRVASPEYRSWQMMKNRCLNPDAKDYAYYGGRGITVCRRWLSFDNFIADMGPRPTPLHTIDRINHALGYSKSNCRWATRKTQSVNRSYCRVKPAAYRAIYKRWQNGERQVDIARDYAVSQSAISCVIRRVECRS